MQFWGFSLRPIMYGKLFATLYEGSMVGAGPSVFAVWCYCIARADGEEHTVILNPAVLAVIIGTTSEDIGRAIEYLCSPDKNSKCTDYEGRRLVNTSGFEYLVVTHAQYRDIRSNADRREYMRKYMREKRSKQDVNNEANKSLQVLTPASVNASVVSDRNWMQGETKPDLFEEAWKAYPSKAGSKHKAQAAYRAAIKDGDTHQTVMEGIARYIAYVAERRAGGFDLHYQNGLTFFNGRGWRSEWQTEKLTACDAKKSTLPSTWHDPNPDMTMRRAF
jgi:hypothetical protein